MIDFTNGNNINRFNPDVYIKTKSAGILAFIKMLEAIIACFGLIGILLLSDKIQIISKNIADTISQSLYFLNSNTLSQAISFILNTPILIPALCFVLIILDCTGIIMMRYSNKGEGLVRFVHTVCWVLYIIEIILIFISFFWYLNQLKQIDKTHETSLTSSLGLLGFFIYPAIALNIGILLFLCNYHHDIRVVLKTVCEERQTESICTVYNNHLAGRCSWFVWWSAILFASNLFIVVYPLITHEQIISINTEKSFVNLSGTILTMISCAISFLIFLKYLSLRICIRNFFKYHKSEPKKSSGKIILLLAVIVCIFIYFAKKNGISLTIRYNNDSNRSGQTSAEIIKSTSSSTPVSDLSEFSSRTSNIQNSAEPTVTAISVKPTSSSGGIDPDLKTFLDSYESYVDKYILFMKSYASNPTDLNLLLQYTSMLSEMEEFSTAAERYESNQSEMSAADYSYYMTVMMRINNKLMTVY